MLEALLIVVLGVAGGLALATHPRVAALAALTVLGLAIAAAVAYFAPRAALDLAACFAGFVLVTVWRHRS
jgi:hypothetical protein